jgi:proline dehydrogenase
MARRFVSGETLDDAVDAVRTLNAAGMMATLDHLGENVGTARPRHVRRPTNIWSRSTGSRRKSSTATSRSNPRTWGWTWATTSAMTTSCASSARLRTGQLCPGRHGGLPYTGRTLDVYRRLRQRHSNVGIVVQAYLHRTQGDVESLIANGMGHFRLCKGAYDEPPSIAYRERLRVTQAMQELIRTCFSPEARTLGAYAAIASHDEDVINFARALGYQTGSPRRGVRVPDALWHPPGACRTDLVKHGYRMRIYVPYGTHWYPYFMRRLAERPANLFFFLRALVGNYGYSGRDKSSRGGNRVNPGLANLSPQFCRPFNSQGES